MATIGFTSKFFKSKLKYGITTQEVLDYFSLSEDAFYEKLNQTFSQDAVDDFLRQLKRNDKKKAHLSKKLPKSSTGPILSDITIINPEDFVEASITSEENNSLDISSLDLVSLNDLLQTLLKEKDELELYHKELNSQNSKEREALKTVKERAIKLKAQLIELTKLAESYLKVINKNGEIMTGLSEQISEKRQKIQQIEEEIQEREKIIIFVYNNGDIEIEDNNYQIPDESKWILLYQQIVSGIHPKAQLFENLTMLQIRQISKLLCFTNSVDKRCELTIENAEVQKVWNELTKK